MKGVTPDAGKPTDNGFIESLNGNFRAECPNASWFLSVDEARAKCDAWRRDHNEVMLIAIGNKTPMEVSSDGSITGRPLTRGSENFLALAVQGWGKFTG